MRGYGEPAVGLRTGGSAASWTLMLGRLFGIMEVVLLALAELVEGCLVLAILEEGIDALLLGLVLA